MQDIDFKRHQVVDYYKRHAPISYAKVARQFGVSKFFVQKWVKRYEATGKVQRQRRKDPKAALRAVKIARAVQIAEGSDCRSADSIACQLESEFKDSVSPSTVRRWLKQQRMHYAPPAFKPLITDAQKAKRVVFANRYLRYDWKKVLVTDSKVFYCFPPRKGHLLRAWVKKGKRRVVYSVKHSQKVNVYLEVCYRGVTKLYFCSGSTGRTSQYQDIKTKKPHSGVCAKEYQKDIAPNIISDGQQLYNESLLYRNSWVYQQDGAPIHTTKDSVAVIQNLVPGGLLEGWTPNSPDLSWIENVWAWMEKELRRRPTCKSAAELEEALTEIWEDLRTNHMPMLRNLANSMRRRLQKVIGLNGAHIGY